MDDEWGTPSRIGKSYKEINIEKEKQHEISIAEMLNNNRRNLKVSRYKTVDKNGKEVAQIIETKYGTIRCLDLYAEENSIWEETLLRIEIKHQTEFHNEKFLKVETYKFRDYLMVQSSEEIEGRILFVVDENGYKYWQRLSYLDMTKRKEYIDKYKQWFYLWDFNDMKVYTTPDEFFQDIY